jgi:hypothetical protein
MRSGDLNIGLEETVYVVGIPDHLLVVDEGEKGRRPSS